MKTTVKEYQAKTAELYSLKRKMYECGDVDRSIMTDAQLLANNEEFFAYKTKIDALQTEYFDNLTKVSVSYSVGSRDYYNEVVKIGKAYLNGSIKMNKTHGYWDIDEIPEITQEMKNEMMSDTYYY